MNEVKDKVGNLIIPGCYIAYGVRCGNSGDLKVGIVKEIKKVDNRDGYFKSINYQLRVRGIYEWSFEKVELGRADGFLQDTDKIVVLNTLPQPYKNLLDNHYAKYIKTS